MNPVQLTFLGTSASTPSRERNLSGVCLTVDGYNYLFDCPEGAQRQMMKSGLSYMKVRHIFLSHFHGDHLLGLPGLLATLTMFEREEKLFVYGPRGVARKVGQAIELAGHRPCFDIECKELRAGTVLREKTHTVRCFALKHDVSAFGFVFEQIAPKGRFSREKALALGIPEGPLWRKLHEGKRVRVKGKTFRPEQVLDLDKAKPPKKVAIVADTLPSYGIAPVRGADVMVHESSFAASFEKRARETHHCTSTQAAQMAKKAGVKKLYLFHISTRHKDAGELEKEAREVFPRTEAARDLQTVTV